MGSSFSIIVIVVIIYVISTVLRALKGKQRQAQTENAAKGPRPAFKALSEPKRQAAIDIWSAGHPYDSVLEAEAEARLAAEKKAIDPFADLYFAAEEEAVPAAKEEGLRPKVKGSRFSKPAPLKRSEADGGPKERLQPGIEALFKSSDSFLTAYVFHEIIDKPVALRRKY